MEQLWERSQEGRKETNRKPSTEIWKESMRNQAGEKEETEEARAETGIGEAAVRRNREEKERKNRKLSSKNRKRSGRKETDRKGRARKREHKGSTGGTAVGAKPGGTKGNEQKAEYEEPGKKI